MISRKDSAYLKLRTKKSTEHCRVPNDFEIVNGFALGSFVGNRRRSFTKGKLSSEHTALLGELGFTWDPLEADFQEGLAYLKAYKKEHGHCRVPDGSGDESTGSHLEVSSVHRRRSFTKGKLSSEHAAFQEGLGFTWDPLEADLQEGLADLKAYKKESCT